jgi:hypothetical protein
MTPEPAPSSPPPFEPAPQLSATPAPAWTPEPTAAPMSEISRLANVFFSPSAAFTAIARRPSWWVPIVLGVLVSVVYIAAYSNHVGWDQLIRQQMDQSSRTQNLTGTQREAAIQTMERFIPIISYVGAVVGPLLMLLIIAVVLMFLFDNIMGANLGLQRMLAIVSYAQLPRLIVTALSMLVMFLKPPEDFDIRNPLVFNIGALIPRDAPQWQRSLGASFDVFTFWILALTAIGICAAAPKMKFGKAFAGVLFPWALWVILVTGYTAAMG